MAFILLFEPFQKHLLECLEIMLLECCELLFGELGHLDGIGEPLIERLCKGLWAFGAGKVVCKTLIEEIIVLFDFTSVARAVA